MALLSLQQIHKTFEKGTVNENHVLRGLDLDIEQGDFISVIGGNGAGKSTLLRAISGDLEPNKGTVELGPGERLSVLEQDHFKYDEFSVMDTVLMGHQPLNTRMNIVPITTDGEP